MDQDLRRALQSQAVKCSDATILSQLASAATAYGLTAKELAGKLGAQLLNQGMAPGTPLSGPAVQSFLTSLAKDWNKENQAKACVTPAAGRWAGKDRPSFHDSLGTGTKAEPQGTPRAIRTAAAPDATPLSAVRPAAAAGSKASPATPQSAPRSAFKSRTNRGQVVSTLNPQIPRASGQEARMIHVEPLGVQLPARYLYLFECLEDKVAAMNGRITAWQRWLRQTLTTAAPGGRAAIAAAEVDADPGGLDIAPVGVPVQEDAYFVGRITCEVEGGHLNNTAVVLEGDTSLSDGARVHLDLSQLRSYRLFPGQVVAVKGVNPSGTKILVKSIWTHLPPPSQEQQSSAGAMDIGNLSGSSYAAASRGLSAVVAAGPFCLADDLTFDPLHELLQDLKPYPPNMLVLFGPFVDVEQPLIAGGMIDITFQEHFKTQVVERLLAWQAALAVPCQVVLLPAVRDAFHHPTFPQPAVNIQPPEQHLVSLQNPCSFSAGGVVLAGVSSDVLRHLSSAELARNEPGAPADRLAALASHIIGQRRFYPLYPAALGSCLDLTGDAALQLQQLPDLLLLPSDLAPFAKLIAAAPATSSGGGYQAANTDAECPQVVAINPGRLTKGGSGGTYAHLTIAEGSVNLASRCRVDIIRV